ncbi:hypothetical protein M0805_007028 [Coniferiporia weirii]|nr:hypothetical protein M0805_007028 [Coniferiporia weirii]
MSSDEKQHTIIVLGAGVIGLTIAHVLSTGPANKVVVVAREMPEHLFSQGWSSPWAGANWSPLGVFDERRYKWEQVTFNKFWSMIPTGLVMELPSRFYYEEIEAFSADPWWKDIVRDFRVIAESEIPPGFVAGVAFTTISVKPGTYLNWMKDELTERGVEFVHRNVGSIEEAAALGGENCVVVNATGLDSKSLFGVEDKDVYPIRGQTIIVNAPHVKEFLVGSAYSRNLADEATYIIPRPDGTCILGGTFQHDNFDLTVNLDTAQRLYERCTILESGLLLSRGTTVLSHNVGLRPSRKGGPRVELESMQLPLTNPLVPRYEEKRPQRKLKVIHAYGLGPAGYQESWGVAEEVANILSRI